jgi:hypothetical protein
MFWSWVLEGKLSNGKDKLTDTPTGQIGFNFKEFETRVNAWN